MQKSSKVSEYFWQLGQEKLEIIWEDKPNLPVQTQEKQHIKQTEELEKNNSSISKNSMQSEKSKKKERRKNPYTQRKINFI